jgi:hypothetical protein
MKKPKSFDSTMRLDNIKKLPLECIMEILKFLKSTFLNQFACCSKTCNEARNDSNLNQTQTGCLNVTTNRATYINLNDAIVCGDWNNHPGSANWMRLVLTGLDNITHAAISQDQLVENISCWETVQLNQVSSFIPTMTLVLLTVKKFVTLFDTSSRIWFQT